MFLLTLSLFGLSWILASTSSRHDNAPMVLTIASVMTSIVGLCLGFASRIRNERRPDLAVAGILLNTAWLMCGGPFLLLGYTVFGRMSGSDLD